MKDTHYWERRRKNNEAAKRSRDARRAKVSLPIPAEGIVATEQLQLVFQLNTDFATFNAFKQFCVGTH